MLIRGNRSSVAAVLLILILINGVSASALVSAPVLSTALTSQVDRSADDAEENLNSGNVNLTSAELQLGEVNNTDQVVGIRFNNITIPRRAVIESAYVEFEATRTGSTPTSLTIRAQATDHAPTFQSEKNNISTRPRTTARVAWNNVPEWPTVGAKQQTPNIAAVIQEIVNRPNWVNGNSIAIIIDGLGERTADAYDGDPAGAPRLVVNFLLPTSTPTQTRTPTPTQTRTPAPTQSPTPLPPGSLSFAVIGDYGSAGQSELDVAALVKSWDPQFIITTGDNNYPGGAAGTIDANIGQYYHEFIRPYTGTYGPGATKNRFFPTLGNHDWQAAGAQPYLNYFELPGNERYYDYVRGPVHFFVIDSDPHEPDGITSASAQAVWLHDQLASSTSAWNLVYMHHPPYSSGSHGSTSALQWPYAAWGADAVLAGHDHTYERIIKNGIPYFVNGLGGNPSRYSFGTPISGSQIRFNGNYGAMLVIARDSQITFQFITRSNTLIDSYTLTSTPAVPPVVFSVTGVETSPTSANQVNYKITFSETVTGVDANDFVPTTSGLAGVKISNVTGSGANYRVSVDTGAGNGTIRLDVKDNDSIRDQNNVPLGGIGIGNGNFTNGAVYEVNKRLKIQSTNVLDGWILESTENGNQGGRKNDTASALYLGDNAANKQFLSMLSFDTSAVSENAVITRVTLKLKRAGVVGGGNPINIFQGFMVDIKNGDFGTAALELGDFKSLGDMILGPFKPTLVGGWYSLDLSAADETINTTGNTQIRLRFKLDDNNNLVANDLKLYSGNSTSAVRPQLIVDYYVP